MTINKQASARVVDFHEEGAIPGVLTDAAAWHNGDYFFLQKKIIIIIMVIAMIITTNQHHICEDNGKMA